jgi:hypothetical protein
MIIGRKVRARQLGRMTGWAACIIASMVAGSAHATIVVSNFGEGGWKSDDTRSSAGANLVGTNYTHAPLPGSTPSAAHDAAIAQQIQFVDGPAGSTYGGAVSIDGTATGSGKSNFSTISPTTGFAPASHLASASFNAQYEMYKQHTGGGSTLAFKIGIQSTQWAASQTGFTAIRSGESVWDLVLVHVPTIPVINNNTWIEVNLDATTGTWTLFRQAGNAYLPMPPPNGGIGSDKTIADWQADATWGNLLFGTGANVSSIQFGLGSGQAIAIGYVDYLETSLINNGETIDFQATAVPEASSFLFGGLLATSLGGAAWWRRKRSG